MLSTTLAPHAGGADTDGDGTPVSQDDLAKKEHLTPMEQSLRELNEGLRAIQDEQRYMRNREVKFFCVPMRLCWAP